MNYYFKILETFVIESDLKQIMQISLINVLQGNFFLKKGTSSVSQVKTMSYNVYQGSQQHTEGCISLASGTIYFR